MSCLTKPVTDQVARTLCLAAGVAARALSSKFGTKPSHRTPSEVPIESDSYRRNER
jgi:hypothetical protein